MTQRAGLFITYVALLAIPGALLLVVLFAVMAPIVFGGVAIALPLALIAFFWRRQVSAVGRYIPNQGIQCE